MENMSASGNSVEPPQLNPLPSVGISEILGLVELLANKGGREDIYKLAAELSMELGDTLMVIRAAELLGLVHTPGGDVVIEPLGERVSEATIHERKSILRERLLLVPIIQKIFQLVSDQDEHVANRDFVLEKLAELLPNEDAEKTFSTLVHWGRYAELFGYSDDSHKFYLDQRE